MSAHCEDPTVCEGVACGETVTDRCGRRVRCGAEPCPTIDAPTLLAPHNGDCTGRAGAAGNALRGAPLRPMFRWNSVASATRYEAQWTSSCTSPGFATCTFAGVTAQSTTDTRIQLSADLMVAAAQPVGQRYWRVRACLGTSVCSAWSEVRYLDVGRVESDFNGDGFSDVVIGAYRAAPRGMVLAGAATVFHGSAAGVVATPARVLEGPSTSASFGYSVASGRRQRRWVRRSVGWRVRRERAGVAIGAAHPYRFEPAVQQAIRASVSPSSPATSPCPRGAL